MFVTKPLQLPVNCNGYLTDMQGENLFLRNELVTLRHDAEIVITELSERIKQFKKALEA